MDCKELEREMKKKRDETEKVTLTISGMRCTSCAAGIEEELSKLNGVTKAKVNFATNNAIVEYDPDKVDIEKMKKAVKDVGYTAEESAAALKREEMSSFGKIPMEYLAKDPVCRMTVDKRYAIRRVIGGRTYYFCMEACARMFESPENELQKMKMRVTVSLSGVIILGILRVAVFLGLAAGVTLVTWVPVPSIPYLTWGLLLFIITTPVQFIGGWGFYIGAYSALKNKRANMDVLISIGTLSAYFYSTLIVFFPNALPVKEKDVYFDVAAVIIAFVLIGKFMEELIKKRSSAAVRKLMDLRPQTARVIRDRKEMKIPAEKLDVGEVVVVRPGEKIPADGVVIEGISSVDEKMISGESVPVEKYEGREVIGGTMNKVGTFKFRTTKVGEKTTLNQIIKIVEEAQASSAPIQRYADTVAAYFVPAVLIAASVTFVAWLIIGKNITSALLAFIAVLIISCPCALGIATPAALMVGVGRGAEMGILIRGGEYIEKTREVQVAVFDKTGTLTKGELKVVDILAVEGTELEVLEYAAVAEKGSEHPIGEAIVRAAESRGMKIADGEGFEAIPGYGVKVKFMGKEVHFGNMRLMRENCVDMENIEADVIALETEGKTVMFVSVDKKIVGAIAVADELKKHSAEAVKELKQDGIEVIILSGDNERTARAVGKDIGVKNVIANVPPQGKAEVIKKLQREGKVVAMVGDGINDAPALAQADVGIAIGSGSDVAKETGGIVLIKDDLRDVVKALKLSKGTMRKIRQNMFWALGYNTAAIPLAAFGLLTPIIAAAAMSMSSLSVVSNAATLKWVRI